MAPFNIDSEDENAGCDDDGMTGLVDDEDDEDDDCREGRGRKQHMDNFFLEDLLFFCLALSCVGVTGNL